MTNTKPFSIKESFVQRCFMKRFLFEKNKWNEMTSCYNCASEKVARKNELAKQRKFSYKTEGP